MIFPTVRQHLCIYLLIYLKLGTYNRRLSPLSIFSEGGEAIQHSPRARFINSFIQFDNEILV